MGEKNKKKKRKKRKKKKEKRKERGKRKTTKTKKQKKKKKTKFFLLPSKTIGCFSGRLMSAASDQKLFCKLCSPFCCSFNEFVEEKVISPSYSSAILTPLSSFYSWNHGLGSWARLSGEVESMGTDQVSMVVSFPWHVITHSLAWLFNVLWMLVLFPWIRIYIALLLSA